MPVTLANRFDAVVARHGDRIAIVEGQKTITYEALAGRVSALARQLTEAGIRPGEIVASLLPNCADAVVAAFAIWRCGGVLLPLHVRFQEREILKYVADCRPRAIIAQVRQREFIQAVRAKPPGVAHAWYFTGDPARIDYDGTPEAPEPASEPLRVTGASPAITQYSTGSTGFSKRVTRTHRHLLGEFEAVAALLELCPEDRILGAAPFYHSYGLMNAMVAAILSGASLHPVGEFFPKDVVRLVETTKITGFPGVPFMFQLLSEFRGRADFSSLRYALSAGAPLARSTAQAFFQLFGTGIRQLYGTTEAGVISVEREPSTGEVDPTAGLPIAGVSIRLIDESGRLVPNGEMGQVAVTSAHAATCYDNLETKSESYFTEGMFFPGDLGRLDEHGRLVLYGRKRRFINVAGNKVDPTEVEDVLREMPAVAEAVVLGLADGAASEKIKAVLVTRMECTRTEIIDYCKQRLAEFKRPRLIEFRKELPKSPLGKILRKYLLDEAESSRPQFRFDPRHGFTDDTPATIDPLASPNFATLPPFLRVLLVTDGTVTKALEAYLWEPIAVELLFHDAINAPQPYPVIGVSEGDRVVKRRIVLRGRITGNAYAFAETVMAAARFPDDLVNNLVESRKGIGELLRDKRAATFRELLDIEQSAAGEVATFIDTDPESTVVSRRYQIACDGVPSILITEVFPLIRFQGI